MFQNTENKIKFNKILQEFSQATGLATVLVGINGEEISEWHQFSEFCAIMRTKPEYKKICEKCDLYGGLEAAKEQKPIPYTCHAGLTDLAMPVVIDKQLVGFILSGQVLTTDQKFPPIYQKSDWHLYPELLKAYKNIRKVNAQQVKSAAEILRILTQYHFPSQQIHSPKISYDIQDIEEIEKPLVNANRKIHEHKEIRSDIAKAIRYIDKNLTNNIHLKVVAEHVYLNPDYFSKLFKSQTGFSFIDYVNQKKIERSLSMLKDKKRSIEKIANELGYSQPSYYCKLFKKITGYSPSEYRNQL
ncbi:MULTISPECIES: PocR ligand-binding domain-containing protein [unclassified Granulicatella]|uniref:PocR ligand-binding domain-containing protein n=1 Tax=unclassified Granulicatella TaxID=2630493 RepID=UPI0013CFE6A2|nr:MULTISPECIES: PocR ligand-binding domain-containing protein [unclassified Granulicatella]QMI85158.1 PocR ligand-binding domain-containing protein [Carnobacteriaceae bacterium zg-84]